MVTVPQAPSYMQFYQTFRSSHAGYCGDRVGEPRGNQPIGGATQKIEGFRALQVQRLTGDRVLSYPQNVRNLVLMKR